MLSTLQRILPFVGRNSNSRKGSKPANQLSSGAALTQVRDTEDDGIDGPSTVWQTLSRAESSSRIDNKDASELQSETMANESSKLSSRLISNSSLLFRSSFERRKRKDSEFLISSDITNGHELLKIPAISYNKHDQPPSDYHYVAKYIETKPMNIDRSLQTLSGCSCSNDCQTECYCTSHFKPLESKSKGSQVQQVSRGQYYSPNGRLSRRFDLNSPQVIYECNAACKCNVKLCPNMIIQKGCQARLVLFKTRSRGWGVRTVDNLRQGSFIGVYSGELITASESLQRKDDTYLFNLSTADIFYVDQNNSEQSSQHEQYVCDAKMFGNFTRFINHSCNPNVIGIRSFTDHHDPRFPYIAFFANQDIKAGSELTLNYGDNYWIVKCKRDKIYCLCKKSACKFSKKSYAKTLSLFQKQKKQQQQHQTEAINQ